MKDPVLEQICNTLAGSLILDEPKVQSQNDFLADYKYATQRCWIALQTGNIAESIKFSESVVKEQDKDTTYHVIRVYILAQCYALTGREIEASELMYEALVLGRKMKMTFFVRSVGGTLLLYMMSLGYDISEEMLLELLPEDGSHRTQQKFEKAKALLLKNGFTLETCDWSTSVGLMKFLLTRFTWVL